MDKIDRELLMQIADIHKTPEGSYNIRKNGECVSRNSTSEIEIFPKKDKSGIDIIVKPNVKNKSVHIPVIITLGGFTDLVYNDFYIGKNAEVTIVAGCGIHNTGTKTSEHDGIHTFHLDKNCKVKYIEKHLGIGNKGDKILNPTTKIFMNENSFFEMETIQLGGVSYANRKTEAKLKDRAKLVVKERILTSENQVAKTNFKVELNGKNCSAEVLSRSVAKNTSKQEFKSTLIGNNECYGRVECDAILTDNAVVISTPSIKANCVDSSLTHEAQIGKIAGEQLTKLLTLGMTKEEAENLIIKGFLN